MRRSRLFDGFSKGLSKWGGWGWLSKLGGWGNNLYFSVFEMDVIRFFSQHHSTSLISHESWWASSNYFDFYFAISVSPSFHPNFTPMSPTPRPFHGRRKSFRLLQKPIIVHYSVWAYRIVSCHLMAREQMEKQSDAHIFSRNENMIKASRHV